MDQTRCCSFCGQTFPAIVYLFRAPDGLAVCDGCVEMLADDLRALRGAEAASQRPSPRDLPLTIH